MAKVLLVEDEANARKVLALSLETSGHEVTSCSGPAQAERALRSGSFDLVLTDLRMEGRDAGLDVVRMSVALQAKVPVLLLTAYASAETAVDAIKLGAFDYITKPVSSEELGDAVERALAGAVSAGEAPEKPGTAGVDLLVGSSIVMDRIRERLRRAAGHDFTLLITGESGTGKEVAARYVHAHSKRADGPFVPVHCGAIPETLFESELFGHKRGAFTGADTDRAGLMETASGGTLFLDEIGEMPLQIQVKLLRVLQEKAVRRVGEEKERKVNLRLIAATNRDLAEDVQKGGFREDLFYRLNVVPVHMPPLRQRREDIPELVHALTGRWSDSRITVPEAVMQRLQQLPLPGNVRELENLLQRLLALSEGSELDVRLLDEFAGITEAAPQALSLASLQRHGITMEQALESIERRLIEDALRETGGNATQAAEKLGISFRSFRYRAKKLGIK